MSRSSRRFLSQLRQVFPKDALLTDPADRWPYGYDNSRRHVLPDVVVFPENKDEVQACVQICNEFGVFAVARGRGTGTTGGAVPLRGGLVLAMERMVRVKKVDPANRVIVVEPGVTNQEVQEIAKLHGFFWPPDPSSADFCTVGGNLACNSGGPRAIKYGVTRDNVLGLEAITGSGTSIRTGVYTTKGVVGYDLTRLLIGSEGTLAVITEATLKLFPLPESYRTLRAIYSDIETAAEAVSRIMAQGVVPCALEMMDDAAIDLIRGHTYLPENAGTLLMIEVDGPESGLEEASIRISEAARGPGLLEIRQSANEEERKALWAARKALSPALRNIAPKKINEDVVVPVSRMAELVTGLRKLSQTWEIPIVNFGHAGNGNLHVNLLFDPEIQMSAAQRCLEQVFDLVLGLGGTLSGEHGVGIQKRDFVDREIEPATLELMRQVKNVFDPKGILNPGKIFPVQS